MQSSIHERRIKFIKNMELVERLNSIANDLNNNEFFLKRFPKYKFFIEDSHRCPYLCVEVNDVRHTLIYFEFGIGENVNMHKSSFGNFKKIKKALFGYLRKLPNFKA